MAQGNQDRARPLGDPRQLRDALGAFATGVTIVTTRMGVQDIGLTANSFSSVSLDPPMVLWSLGKQSSSLPAFAGAAHFAVHVLAADQEPLSRRFATRDIDRFAQLEIERGESQIPLLGGCAARFQCRSAFQYEGGDHIIFVGEVVDFEHAARPPLVFHGGDYALAARRAEQLGSDRGQPPPTGFGEDLLGYLVGRTHHQLYGNIRRELTALGLTEKDHFVLSVLGIADRRTAGEIDRIIGYTGFNVDDEAVARLARARLVRGEDAGGARRWELTDAGKRTLVRLVAAAKAGEADALKDLDDGEAHLLRHLLKRVIRATDPGVADLWPGSEGGE